MLSTTPIIVTSKSLVRARMTLYCQLHQLLRHQSRWLEPNWQRYVVNYTNYCDIKVIGQSQIDNVRLSTTPIIVKSKSLVRARLTTLHCQLHQLLGHQSHWLEPGWQRYVVNYTNYWDIKVIGQSQIDNVMLSTTPIIVTSKSLVRARLTTLCCQLHQLLWHQSRWSEPDWQRYVVNYTNYWDIKVIGQSQTDNVMLSTTPIIVTSKSLVRARLTTLYCQLHQLLWHQSRWLEPDWQRYVVNYTNYWDIKVVGQSQIDNIMLSTTPIIVTSKSLVRARLTT